MVTGLAAHGNGLVALANAIALWADATTGATSERRHDLTRDKRADPHRLLSYGRKPARPSHSARRVALARRPRAPRSAAGRLSRVSSFYQWVRSDPIIGAAIATNPVDLARPEAPRSYQSAGVQSLSDDQLRALVDIVRAKADGGERVAKRDYALLMFFLLTGMRRAKVIRLRRGDFQLGTVLTITGLVKGGDYVTREVRDPRLAAAIKAYFVASGRPPTLTPESPLWTGHDFAKPAHVCDEPLTPRMLSPTT